MTNKQHKVAIIGCGRLGQYYAEAYSTYPDTEIVAIAEHNPERREQAGKQFNVKNIYSGAQELLDDIVPDIAAIVTPSKHYKDAVIACANASNPSGCKDSPPINLENTQATSWNTPSGLYAIGIISSNSQVQFTANPSEGFNGYGVSACFSSQTGSTKVVESSTKERLVTPPNCN